MKQFSPRVNSLICTPKKWQSCTFDHGGLENKFFPNKITQSRNYTIFILREEEQNREEGETAQKRREDGENPGKNVGRKETMKCWE